MSIIRNLYINSRTAALVLGILAAVTILPSCSKQKPEPPKKPAVPVAIASSVRKTVPVQIRAIGNVEAYSTVAVKSQMGGQLFKVHFTEGQDVKKGDLLFTIDPRPYEALVKQAEAVLARDTAQMENAREDAKRYAELVKKGYVAKEQYEQFRTNALALEATVNADKAALDTAKLRLGYCFIHAPVTGRTGSLVVDEGNLIKENAESPMVVINQIRPIYISFSLPEKELSMIRGYLSGGKLKVEAQIAGLEGQTETGQVSFLDNTVDPATATIKLKGTFANSAARLWPGQFVTVLITLSTIQDAVLVPSQAVQTGQQGQYVFVVKGDTAELRPVTAGISHEGMTVIQKGLEPEEQVVTDGQMRLMPGARIEVKSKADAGSKPAASPAPAADKKS